MLEIGFMVAGLVLALAGIAGAILPVIPGPPLSFLALLLISWAKAWQPVSPAFLTVCGLAAVVLSVLDYFAPLWGAKKFGASRAGVWGSVVGLVAGLFFFPPWGPLLGAFAGALGGELLSGKRGRSAVGAGWGVLLGTMVGIGLKLAYGLALLVVCIGALFI